MSGEPSARPLSGCRRQLGERRPGGQVALGLRQRLQRLVRRADVGRPVGPAPLALGVRLRVREQARVMAVQVPRWDLAVEAAQARGVRPSDPPAAERLRITRPFSLSARALSLLGCGRDLVNSATRVFSTSAATR